MILMGFMDAAAAKEEREDGDDSEMDDDEDEKKTKSRSKSKAKGNTTKRQSPLAIGRAVSLRPYRGEMSFNCVSGDKEKGRLRVDARITTRETGVIPTDI